MSTVAIETMIVKERRSAMNARRDRDMYMDNARHRRTEGLHTAVLANVRKARRKNQAMVRHERRIRHFEQRREGSPT